MCCCNRILTAQFQGIVELAMLKGVRIEEHHKGHTQTVQINVESLIDEGRQMGGDDVGDGQTDAQHHQQFTVGGGQSSTEGIATRRQRISY